MPEHRSPLGQAELKILQYISEHYPISVRDVAQHTAQTTGQARTTVLTVMERLRQKGYLSRRKVRGIYHYRPKVSQSELLQELVKEFVESTLGSSISPFVAYLTKSASISDEELEGLKQLVRDLEDRPPGDK